MSLSQKRKLRPRKVQQCAQGHKAYLFYKVTMIYWRYSYLTMNQYFFQLSFMDNLEQIKTLIFFFSFGVSLGLTKIFERYAFQTGERIWQN